MPQDNTLHTYIRIDASGRDIAGTNVLRRKLPKTGKWRQLDAYECCNFDVTILTSTPADVTLTTVNFTLNCGAVAVIKNAVTATSTDLASLVGILNTNFSFYGTFSVSGTTDIQLDLVKSIGEGLCPTGILSFVIS